MFKKLKDKIADEVKQSPLKTVQQLAQAVVSPTSSSVFEPSSSNDKFCIEEGDIEGDESPAAAQSKPGGFTSVTLTGQTSSPVRDQKYGIRSSSNSFSTDTDNFFPVFESQPSSFHVQSDWESASEVEDRYSQLEHITKESLYDAYRKVFNRHSKMKNKYHELVTHYRQLERDRDKAKTVLSATQDKALMRISELREQCLLEQQAKAHLEEALRNELEERDHIIKTLKTKVQYLKTVNEGNIPESLDVKHLPTENTENLIDFTDSSAISKVPLSLNTSSPQVRIDWIEKQLNDYKEFLSEKTTKIEGLNKELEEMKHNYENNRSNAGGDSKSEPTSKDEHAIYQSLVVLVNDICKGVKSIHDDTASYLQFKHEEKTGTKETEANENMDMRIKEHEITTNSGFSEIDVDLESKCQKSVKDICDIHNGELKRYVNEIKELEEQNKLLNQKLNETDEASKLALSEVNCYKEKFDLLNTEIKTVNENFKNGSLSLDSCDTISLTSDDLVKEISCCVKNLINTRSELKRIENLNMQLEIDLKSMKDQIKLMEKELNTVNSSFKAEMLKLEKENDFNVTQQKSLSLEVAELKKTNEELKNHAKELMASLSASEKEGDDRHNVNLNLISEKNTLKDTVSCLEVDLEKAKADLSLLLDTKEKMAHQISSVTKENEGLRSEKSMLQSKIEELEEKFKLSEKDNAEDLNTKEKLLDELSFLRKELNSLAIQKNESAVQIINLQKNLDKINCDYESALNVNGDLSEKVAQLTLENDTLSRNSLNLQTSNENIEKEYEKEKNEHAQTLKELTNELFSTKQNYDEMVKYRDDFKNQLDELIKNTQNSKIVYASLLESKEKLSEELALLKAEHQELEEEKKTLDFRLEKLDEDLANSKKDYLVSISTNKELLDEVALLKKEFEDGNSKKYEMQDNFSKIASELEESKKNYTLLLETKSILSNQLEELKKERNDFENSLSNTSKLLEGQKTDCEDLKRKLSSLSQTLKNNCEAMEEKCQENTCLKSDADNLLKKLSETESLLQQTTLEKHDLFNNLVTKLTAVKSIRQVQLNLLAFVQLFRTEIIRELNEIQQKVEKDLKYQVNDFLEENKAFKKHAVELELKSKKHNDSKNSKIKYLQEEFQNADKTHRNEFTTEKTTLDLEDDLSNCKKLLHDLQEHYNELQLKCNNDFKSWEEKEFELNSGVSHYQNRCSDLKLKLKQAASIMKSLKPCLKLESESDDQSYDNGSNQNGTFFIHQRNEIVHKHIAALESFVSEFDSEDDDENSAKRMYHVNVDNRKSDPTNTRQNTNQSEEGISKSHANAEIQTCHSEISEKHYLDKASAADPIKYIEIENLLSQQHDASELKENESCSLELQQLRQEIKLKDDIICKLQYVVQELEQVRDENSFENLTSKHNKCPKQPVTSNLVRSQASFNEAALKVTNDVSDDTLSLLKKENKALLEEIHRIQETNEFKVRNLIAEYDQKLEEKKEERESLEFEKLGSDKKHIFHEMKEQIENLQQDLDERGDAFEKLYEEHQQSTKSKDEEIHQLRNSYEKEMREQDKKWRSCLDRRVAEEEKRCNQAIADLTQGWNLEKKELQTAHRLAVSVMESGSSSSDMLRRQVQALTIQLTELQNNRCEMCDHQRSFKSKDRNPVSSSRSIQDCTEMEYLRNILYEYMMGKEPLVLAKVLCALMKFDENQTKDIVLKEEQKITMFGQLGIL